MKIRKQISGFLAAALFASVLPVAVEPAQAANSVALARVDSGDNNVRVNYTDARSSDVYKVYVKTRSASSYRLLEDGDLNKTGSGYVNLPQRTGNRETLYNGDVVKVEMTAPNNRTVIDTVTVGGDSYNNDNKKWVYGGYFSGDYYYDRNDERFRYYTASNGDRYYWEGDTQYFIDISRPNTSPSRPTSGAIGPWPPSTMTVSPESLTRGESQNLRVSFDRDYTPADGDELHVVALAADGTEMSTEKLSLYGQNQNSVIMPLSPPADVASYRVEYKGAPGNAAELKKTVSVSGTPAEPGFGVATGIILGYPDGNVKPDQAIAAPTVQLVDAKGKKQTASGTTFDISGAALADNSATTDGAFKIKADATPGSTVQVVAKNGGLSESKTFTVQSPQAQGLSLALSAVAGKAGAENTVAFTLSKDGQAAPLPFQPTVARVEFVSGDAAVRPSGTVTDMATVAKDGKGVLKLRSEAAGQTSLRVQFSDATGNLMVTMTVPFRFDGDAATPTDPVEKHDVTLNIGSTNIVVDGKAEAIDTAPVIKDSRTFVPYRAVAQSFGAKVDYDDAKRSVTTTLGEHTVVMVVGERNYSVDGKTQVIDVAPFIENGRTMVPVRFLAEALGFKVTPLYNPNGTTQSVIFSNK